MNIDKYGRVEVSETEAMSALYSGKITDLSNVYINDPKIADQYNASKQLNADRIPTLETLENLEFVDLKFFDESNQCDWFMPKDYCPDLITNLYGLCETEEQITRVNQELELFIQHGMFDLLFYLKYLVDTMRENNIVWGVGRGSSVASYVLYLIGVHKIDSIKYKLDINEFLK